MVQTIGWIIGVSFFWLAFPCWFAGAYFGIRAAMLRKPGVSLFSPRIVDCSGYTEAGYSALKKGRLCMVGFLVCVLLSIVVGSLTGSFLPHK